ncbi:MAG: Uma2 family endonuclease [Thermomicrobiales bacterium]
MVATRLYTAEDVIKLAAGSDDHFELIEGELIRMSPATFEHGGLGASFVIEIGGYARAHRLGKVLDSSTGYFFARDPDTLLEPDVTFVRADRLPPRDAWRSFSEVVPDLVVEITSPSQTRAHIQRKIEIYLAAGVRLIWFVHPRRQSITVYAPGREAVTLGAGDELDGEDVLPGFRLAIDALFRQ